MFYVKQTNHTSAVRIRYTCVMIFIALFSTSIGCSNLVPDGTDLRSHNTSSIVNVGDSAPDFSLVTTAHTTLNLTTALSGKNAVVLYFTMWCPVCTSHTDEMLQTLVNTHPNVRFVFVDYVSASLSDTISMQHYSGYDGKPIDVAFDETQRVMNTYGATMASTIVVDSTGKVRMNETYKKVRLDNLLSTL
ncbi:MAG: Thiol-disulfide oxidoreductase ResA [Turneriella sp.]|nr:Thiol-disulfide oxidoreductase ResA [Turneriella sp.]